MTNLKSAADVLAEMDARIESKAAQRKQAMRAADATSEALHELHMLINDWMTDSDCGMPVGPVAVSTLFAVFADASVFGIEELGLADFIRALRRHGSVDQYWVKDDVGAIQAIMVFKPESDWTVAIREEELVPDYTRRSMKEIRQWADANLAASSRKSEQE